MNNRIEIFWKDYEKVTVLEFDTYMFAQERKQLQLFKEVKKDEFFSMQFSELIALVNLEHVLYFKIIENSKKNEKKEKENQSINQS